MLDQNGKKIGANPIDPESKQAETTFIWHIWRPVAFVRDVSKLRKRVGEVRSVHGCEFRVRESEIFRTGAEVVHASRSFRRR